MDNEDNTVTFRYIFADDYNPVAANGVYGGVTPNGEIVVNFYFERHALPYAEIHELTQEGRVADIVEREPADVQRTFVRFITNGIVVDAAVAKIIHTWLGGQIVKAEQQAARRAGEP